MSSPLLKRRPIPPSAKMLVGGLGIALLWTTQSLRAEAVSPLSQGEALIYSEVPGQGPVQLGQIQVGGRPTATGESTYLVVSPRSHYRATIEPEPLNFLYTVQGGDSLWAIAERFGTSVEAIVASNPAVRSTLIHPGDELQLVLSDQPAKLMEEPIVGTLLASRSGSSTERSLLQRLIWPIVGASTSSEYGESRWSGSHTGLDFVAPTGTTVRAAATGVVRFAGWDGGYGYAVILDHGEGIETQYAHASKLLVAEGEIIRQGDPVILVGSTGNSTGPHLHFEVRLHGVAQDPRRFVSEGVGPVAAQLPEPL